MFFLKKNNKHAVFLIKESKYCLLCEKLIISNTLVLANITPTILAKCSILPFLLDMLLPANN